MEALVLALGLSDGCMKWKESMLYHFTLGDSGLKSANETCAEPYDQTTIIEDSLISFFDLTHNNICSVQICRIFLSI